MTGKTRHDANQRRQADRATVGAPAAGPGGIDLQHGPKRGAKEFKLIAAMLEEQVIDKSLTHPGLNPHPPPSGRTREAGHDVAA